MRAKLPLQPAGWVVLAVGLASVLGALGLRWRELLVLAIGCAAVLAVAAPFVLGRSEIRLERRLPEDRVTVGDLAVVELAARNTGSVPTTRQSIRESIDGEPLMVDLPPLTPGGETVVTWNPLTSRRGRFRLGPARISKTDPCHLMQRDVGQTGTDELWVQPRVVPLGSFVGGLAKDMDGPTFDHSPAGDVAFHAIRPYRPGDDVRHVHWMATARAGEMMVRHYVDNRQPFVNVVLDTSEASWDSLDDFDAGIDIVASIGASFLQAGHPVAVHAGADTLVGSGRRSTRQQLLDDLTLVGFDENFDIADAAGPLIAGERNTTIAVVVIGPHQPADSLMVPCTRAAQSCAVVVVRVARDQGGDDAVTGRGVRYLEVVDVEDFSANVAQPVART